MSPGRCCCQRSDSGVTRIASAAETRRGKSCYGELHGGDDLQTLRKSFALSLTLCLFLCPIVRRGYVERTGPDGPGRYRRIIAAVNYLFVRFCMASFGMRFGRGIRVPLVTVDGVVVRMCLDVWFTNEWGLCCRALQIDWSSRTKRDFFMAIEKSDWNVNATFDQHANRPTQWLDCDSEYRLSLLMSSSSLQINFILKHYCPITFLSIST